MGRREEVYEWAQAEMEMFKLLTRVWDHEVNPIQGMERLMQIGREVGETNRDARSAELERVRETERRKFEETMAKMPSILRDVAPSLLSKK